MTVELRVVLDVEMARVPTQHGERALVVDLWLPQHVPGPLPTVVYIHGGGWQQGTQYRPPFQPRLSDEGIAIAAVTYRFGQEAPFPACLYDCKLAVRWLRAHAGAYGLDATRFAAWGISAGGHLVALLGLTNHQPEWEGDGPWREHSSAVSAVCTWCGVHDFLRPLTDPEPGVDLVPLLSNLLGGPLAEKQELAAAASPIQHVHPGSPPFLLVHGDEDPYVPVQHSVSLHETLRAAGVASELVILGGSGHTIVDQPEAVTATRRFLTRHLLPA